MEEGTTGCSKVPQGTGTSPFAVPLPAPPSCGTSCIPSETRLVCAAKWVRNKEQGVRAGPR